MDYINIVKTQVNLKEGKSIIDKYLSIIYFHGPVSNKELARELTLPIPVVTAIKKEFIKLGILEQNNGIQMTSLGRDYFSHECGYEGIEKELYLNIMNDVAERANLIKNLCNKYNDIFENRPMVDVTIDQAKATIDTSFKRALLCLENSSLIGKRVLCIGDDDLISVAIALLLKEIFPRKKSHSVHICVFDIDDRYIDYIRAISNDYKLPIECIRIDLKDTIPIAYQDSFDCFFTDPPYTTEGMSLFLSRGISALKKEKGLKIFLSYGQKPLNETLLMQESILAQGLIISDILKAFNKYEGAAILGNISQMMILETTDKAKALIPENEKFDKYIYTREIKEPNSKYECKDCKKPFNLGSREKYKTIEELKAIGCPFCGNNSFKLKSNAGEN